MKKLKSNWLLILAIIFYCQFLYASVILKIEIYQHEYGVRRFNMLFFLLSALLIAPIFEELVFRAMYAKNKINSFYSIVFLLFSSIAIYSRGFDLWWLLPILTVFIVFFVYISENKSKIPILVFYSSVIFTLSHFSDHNTWEEIIAYGGNFMGGALLLSWIAINYNLLKAVLIHASFNLLAIMHYLFFASTISSSGYLNDTVKYSIKEVSAMKVYYKGKIKRTNSEFTSQNANINLILTSIETPANKKVIMRNALQKFNIKITDNNNSLESNEILKILEEANVIALR